MGEDVADIARIAAHAERNVRRVERVAQDYAARMGGRFVVDPKKRESFLAATVAHLLASQTSGEGG